jgi:amidase
MTTEAPTGVPVHEDCKAAVREAAELCASLGHQVEEATPQGIDGDAIAPTFITVWSAGNAWTLTDWARRTGRTIGRDDVEPLTWALAEMGRQQTAEAYLLAVADLQRLSRQVARFMESHDVWLTPTLAEPPVPLGTFDSPPDNPLQGLFRAAAFVPFTPLCNITGQPAMSMPLHWNAERLPIGTHFIGRYGDEATLFRLAAQLEEARPWADRRPPASA